MARHRFGPEVVWTADTTFTPPHAQLAPGAAFTVWTDWQSGTDVSGSLTQIDGVTPYATVVGSDGEIPVFMGPDTLDTVEIYALYVDAGSGERYPLYADDRIRELIDTGAAGAGETANEALTLAQATADTLASLSVVQNMGGVSRIWGRTAAQGLPTTAEGVLDGDYVFLDA